MNARLIQALNAMPEKAIVEQLGWEAFLKYKEASWWTQSEAFRARCSLPEYLGMTAYEHFQYTRHGRISERVKRVWA